MRAGVVSWTFGLKSDRLGQLVASETAHCRPCCRPSRRSWQLAQLAVTSGCTVWAKAELLEHLAEVERRRPEHLDWGFSSLWDLCRRELQWSEANTPKLSQIASKKAWDRLAVDLAPVKREALDALTQGEAFALYIELREPILSGNLPCLDCEIFDDAVKLIVGGEAETAVTAI